MHEEKEVAIGNQLDFQTEFPEQVTRNSAQVGGLQKGASALIKAPAVVPGI